MGWHEHGPKTWARSPAQHENNWAVLARHEGRAGPCLRFRPIVPPGTARCPGPCLGRPGSCRSGGSLVLIFCNFCHCGKKTFQMVVFMICGPCLGWHGPKVARRAFGPCWAVVSGLRPSTARPGKIPCLIGPARFSPKHDGSVPCRPGTAQLSALSPTAAQRSGSKSPNMRAGANPTHARPKWPKQKRVTNLI